MTHDCSLPSTRDAGAYGKRDTGRASGQVGPAPLGGGLTRLPLSGAKSRRPARRRWNCASAASLESRAAIEQVLVEFEDVTANPGSQSLGILNDDDSLDVVVGANRDDALRLAPDAAIVTAAPPESPHCDRDC